MKTLSKKCFPLGMRIVIKALLPVLSVALLVGASGSAAAESSGAETDLPLPVWEPDEWQRLAKESSPASLGGLVPTLGEDLSLDTLPLGPALSPKYLDGPPAVFQESDPASRAGLSLFLPDGISLRATVPEVSDHPRPTPLHQLRDVTPEFLAAVEAWPSDDPLIDPDHVLSETPAEDIRRFLGYHAEQADIPITVLVLNTQEKLPSVVALERFVQGSLSRRRAALLVYPVAEPWRARLFLPRAAHEAVSATFLSRMLEACLSEANRTTLPDDQLHEYVVQLSIRLFWLQKELSKSQPSSQAFADHAQTPPLAEVGGMTPADVLPAEQFHAGHLLHLPPASFITIAILLGFLLAVTARRILRSATVSARKRQHTRIWTLPDKETPQRLGGAFCGGSGAWGSWK
jgi:hypothetical protein